MKKISTQQLTFCGVMAALVFVMSYFPKMPVPVTGGYVHLGDGAIFLAVLLMGPLGIPAAAIGSGLSDLIGGYMLYVLPTLIIKAAMALIVWKLYRKNSCFSAVIAFVAAETVMVLGYFAFECVASGTAAAAAAILPNVIQGVTGVALGLVCVVLEPRLKKMLRV